jgi:hypothetical protein
MEKRYKYRNIASGLLLIIFILLPIFIRLKITEISGVMLLFFPSQGSFSNDLAMYYKSLLLVVLIITLTLFYLGEHIFPDTKIKSPLFTEKSNRIYLILAGVFCLFALLSLLFSAHQPIAQSGAPNSFEGTPVLICYMLLFLLAINYFDDVFNAALVMKALPFLFGFLILFGLTEFFYKSPLEIPFFEYLYLPINLWSEVGKFAVSQYHGYISLTFSTPNDAGTFIVMLLPLSFALIINSRGRRKIIYTFLSALLVLLLFLTGSAAALYAFFASLIVLVLIYRRQLLKAYKGIAAAVLIVVLLLTVATLIKGDAVLAPLTGGGKDTFTTQGRNLFHVDELQLDKDKILFKGEQNTLVVQAIKTGFAFFDQNGHPLSAIKKGASYTFSKPFQAISLTTKDSNFKVDLGYKSPVLFTLQNGVVYAVGPNGTLLSNISDNSGIGFKNMQSFATGRGYIWQKSLPLLSQTLILGYGADNTAFHIPQNDFAGKLNYQGSASILIDKPHNLFLQTALNTGIPSLIALLSLFAVFAVRSGKELILNKKITYDTSFHIRCAILAGVAGYLVCGLFYDGSVSTAPFFWGLLGMGVALDFKHEAPILVRVQNVKKHVKKHVQRGR